MGGERRSWPSVVGCSGAVVIRRRILMLLKTRYGSIQSDVASNRNDKITPTLLFAVVVHRDTAVQNSDTNVVFQKEL